MKVWDGPFEPRFFTRNIIFVERGPLFDQHAKKWKTDGLFLRSESAFLFILLTFKIFKSLLKHMPNGVVVLLLSR